MTPVAKMPTKNTVTLKRETEAEEKHVIRVELGVLGEETLRHEPPSCYECLIRGKLFLEKK